MINGKIIKGIGDFTTQIQKRAFMNVELEGYLENKITPLVGDRVSISVVDEENKKVLQRKLKKEIQNL